MENTTEINQVMQSESHKANTSSTGNDQSIKDLIKIVRDNTNLSFDSENHKGCITYTTRFRKFTLSWEDN